MDAVTLIEQAQRLGLALSVDAGWLNITGPKTVAAAALVQRMKPHKAELIAMLTLEPAPTQATKALDVADDFALTGYDSLSYGDLTTWVGQMIDSDTWQGLQEECCRRYGNGFVFTAVPVSNGWQVRRLATADCGCPRGAVDG